MPSSDPAARIVHLTTVPQTLSFLHGQVGYMKDRGFEVHAISSPGAMLDQFGEVEGVPVRAVPMTRQVTPLLDLVMLWRLYRLLTKIKPTILHAHSPKGMLLGMLSAAMAGVPVRVCTLHGLGYVPGSGLKGALVRSSTRLACTLAHSVLCVSPSSRDAAHDEGIANLGKLRVLGNGSANGIQALSRFNPALLEDDARRKARQSYGIPQDAIVIGFVGRIVRDKGLGELARAWAALSGEYPRAHLLIVGEFEAQDPVGREVEEAFAADERVHLPGRISVIETAYACMDLLVLPTYREGLPTAALEAAAMALPVVATRAVGCVDAVVDGVTGTLVPVRDWEALATATRTYLQDPALRARHGQAGRERVLHDFQPSVVWDAVYQEYVSLLRARRLRIPQAVSADGG